MVSADQSTTYPSASRPATRRRTAAARSAPSVVMIDWPSQSDRVSDPRLTDWPRLLFVAEAADPPVFDDPLIDWVRVPADERDIEARIEALTRRAERPDGRPRLDPYGRLHHSTRWLMIPSPIDRRLLEALISSFGDVVTFDDLIAHGWEEEGATPNALRVHIMRLNRRIESLGLAIRGAHAIGYGLDHRESKPTSARRSA